MRLSMRVWDLPVRSFHWIMTVLLVVSYVTQLTHHYTYHILSGETLLALLVWRIVWGFVGSDTARFAMFLRSPAEAVRHLAGMRRREPDDQIGHNAAGGWWVVLMLALVGVQIVSGLLGSDDGEHGGPLFHLLSKAWAGRMAAVHAVNFYLLLGAVVVHVLVIGAYALFKGQNLLRPMWTGKKRLDAAVRAPRMASAELAALVLACSAGLVVLVLRALDHR
jgi:cytochrome b